MGRMKELVSDIQQMLVDGRMPEDIAAALDIPVSWVYEAEDMFYDEPSDGFLSDAEADADALASAGWGTDEDYSHDTTDFDW
jgi:hypothetical protein